MRNEKWTAQQNKEQVVREYKKAIQDGAKELALRIIAANPDIDFAKFIVGKV